LSKKFKVDFNTSIQVTPQAVVELCPKVGDGLIRRRFEVA
jgi:hypothetical protein